MADVVEVGGELFGTLVGELQMQIDIFISLYIYFIFLFFYINYMDFFVIFL